MRKRWKKVVAADAVASKVSGTRSGREGLYNVNLKLCFTAKLIKWLSCLGISRQEKIAFVSDMRI